MQQILIINGPNLNLLGVREPSIYGNKGFKAYFEELCAAYDTQAKLSYYQSNSEGALIDKLHEVGFAYDGIILNAGAYTHTSVAIADAIAAIQTQVVEVHISNVHAREAFRHKSYLSKYCKGIIVGFGLLGYELALKSFLEG
ncbi:MAG: type II 3-dehydroquinate dehydratase [Flammeovirgaceae bacterium]